MNEDDIDERRIYRSRLGNYRGDNYVYIRRETLISAEKEDEVPERELRLKILYIESRVYIHVCAVVYNNIFLLILPPRKEYSTPVK